MVHAGRPSVSGVSMGVECSTAAAQAATEGSVAECAAAQHLELERGEETRERWPHGGIVSGSGGGGGSGSGDVAEPGGSEGTRRARVFEAVASIARDPPLVFSEEVLGVFNAGRRRSDSGQGRLGQGGGDDGEGGGGYGPEMDRVVESLTSLGR